jgi:hypothetical protein
MVVEPAGMDPNRSDNFKNGSSCPLEIIGRPSWPRDEMELCRWSGSALIIQSIVSAPSCHCVLRGE